MNDAAEDGVLQALEPVVRFAQRADDAFFAQNDQVLGYCRLLQAGQFNQLGNRKLAFSHAAMHNLD